MNTLEPRYKRLMAYIKITICFESQIESILQHDDGHLRLPQPLRDPTGLSQRSICWQDYKCGVLLNLFKRLLMQLVTGLFEIQHVSSHHNIVNAALLI